MPKAHQWPRNPKLFLSQTANLNAFSGKILYDSSRQCHTHVLFGRGSSCRLVIQNIFCQVGYVTVPCSSAKVFGNRRSREKADPHNGWIIEAAWSQRSASVFHTLFTIDTGGVKLGNKALSASQWAASSRSCARSKALMLGAPSGSEAISSRKRLLGPVHHQHRRDRKEMKNTHYRYT